MRKKQYLQENEEQANKILVMLLYLVKTGKDIFSLLELGCDIAQIPILLQQAREREYVHRVEGKLSLTERGEEMIEKLNGYMPKNKKSIIAPRYDAKIRSIPLEAIYLPGQIGQYQKREKG